MSDAPSGFKTTADKPVAQDHAHAEKGRLVGHPAYSQPATISVAQLAAGVAAARVLAARIAAATEQQTTARGRKAGTETPVGTSESDNENNGRKHQSSTDRRTDLRGLDRHYGRGEVYHACHATDGMSHEEG